MRKLEIEKNKIDFKSLWKIGKIDVDKVTFVKYEIERTDSIEYENKETIVLAGLIGEETHKCSIGVIMTLGRRVGDVIKGFVLEKKGKSIKVEKIIEIEDSNGFRIEEI